VILRWALVPLLLAVLHATSFAQFRAPTPGARLPNPTSGLTLNRVVFASSRDWFLVDGLPVPSPKRSETILFLGRTLRVEIRDVVPV
jgi:hypothetical protein